MQVGGALSGHGKQDAGARRMDWPAITGIALHVPVANPPSPTWPPPLTLPQVMNKAFKPARFKFVLAPQDLIYTLDADAWAACDDTIKPSL